MKNRLLSPRLTDHKSPANTGSTRGRARVRAVPGAGLLVLLLGCACAHYEPPPPKAPVHHALRERPAPGSEQKEDFKIYRAPPPDYGNKVVVCGEDAVPKG